MTRWGLVATIKAPARDVVSFAAWHIEAGADRLFIYLDDENEDARRALAAHPKCDVIVCDDAWWADQTGKPPVRHQVRQSRNASHAYARASDLDWIIHLDVDEFIISPHPVGELLSRIPPGTGTARVRPDEALCPSTGGTPVAFKAFIPNGPDRRGIVGQLYPTFGPYLKGGFVSHAAGKVFTRTGFPDVALRIHNSLCNGTVFSPEHSLDEVHLAHLHTTSWDHWLEMFRFRYDRGSYRADLAPATPAEQGGMTLHDLFGFLLETQGEAGLRTFFDEVCADTPALRGRLQTRGLLRLHDLETDAAKNLHFPGFSA